MTGRAGSNGSGPRDKVPPGSRSSVPPASADSLPPAAPNTPTPSAEIKCPLRRVVRVQNPNGLHMRLADRFIRTASQYSCTVTIWKGDSRADGKSIVDLIMLVVMPDSEVILEVDGPDAVKAVDLLAEVLGSPGGEDYTI